VLEEVEQPHPVPRVCFGDPGEPLYLGLSGTLEPESAKSTRFLEIFLLGITVRV